LFNFISLHLGAWSKVKGYFQNFCGEDISREITSLLKKLRNDDYEKHHEQNADKPPDKHRAVHHLHN